MRELESLPQNLQIFWPDPSGPRHRESPRWRFRGIGGTRADLEPGASAETRFSIRGVQITYNAGTQELEVQGLRVPVPLRNGRQRLTVYCDRTGLEIFASDGLTHVPVPFQPASANRSLSVEKSWRNLEFRSLDVYELRIGVAYALRRRPLNA